MELTLKEKYLVISYHPTKGIRIAGSFMSLGIAGAILMELAEQEKISVENKRIRLLNTHNTGDDVLDGVIAMLRKANKPMRIKSLISKIAHKPSKFKKPILEGLISKRVLKKQRKKFLIFPYYRYPVLKADYREKLIGEIRGLILKNSAVDNHIVMLAGLAGSSQCINKFFKSGNERKIAKKRIKEIIADSQIDQAISETVQAVQAAILVSVGTTAAISAST
jgi:hypothetical protein